MRNGRDGNDRKGVVDDCEKEKQKWKRKRPIDVGHEIAKILLEWRPERNADDVAGAIIHALFSYTKTIDGPTIESGLRDACLRSKGKSTIK